MAGRKLTPRQEEIVGLMNGQPGITAKEIAATLETTPQAIYQQITRLRRAGVRLPKRGKAKVKRAASESSAGTESAVKGGTRALGRINGNGKLSLEDHLSSELKSVVTRLGVVREAKVNIVAEEAELSERQQRLDAAKAALAA